MKGRVLQIFRDGRRHERQLFQQLPVGAEGNLETLAVMKRIVVEDSKQKDLKAFAIREIVGTDKRTTTDKVKRAFEFARDEIIYSPEKDGLETVADLWSCLYCLNFDHPAGDCAIKCVALATLLSYFDLKPSFTAIRQVPNATFFNHVYLTCRIDGKQTALDPTPRDFQIGDETNSLSRIHYKIFND